MSNWLFGAKANERATKSPKEFPEFPPGVRGPSAPPTRGRAMSGAPIPWTAGDSRDGLSALRRHAASAPAPVASCGGVAPYRGSHACRAAQADMYRSPPKAEATGSNPVGRANKIKDLRDIVRQVSPACPISVQYLGTHSDGQAWTQTRCIRMIRIAITPAAYEAIIATLPQGAPLWPVERQGGECLVHVEGRPLSTVSWPCAGPARATARSSCGSLSWRRSVLKAGRPLDGGPPIDGKGLQPATAPLI